jgi:hypothetical protein
MPALSGWASFYGAPPGTAAAGPALRAFLGKHWRGSVVRVCATRCVRLTLITTCQCLRGTAHERIIDLSERAFAALGDPSRGLIRVVVE